MFVPTVWSIRNARSVLELQGTSVPKYVIALLTYGQPLALSRLSCSGKATGCFDVLSRPAAWKWRLHEENR